MVVATAADVTEAVMAVDVIVIIGVVLAVAATTGVIHHLTGTLHLGLRGQIGVKQGNLLISLKRSRAGH